jgi:S-adenosylmethionine-diacylglycerol 3-amino-3-carboxypropyl transferase
MNSFLQTLNYSSSNEDSRSEIQALQLNEKDTVLCITGSGARTLDLLIELPAEIVSIDFNPCQNFLLELKMSAIRQLEYEEFIEFLGCAPSTKRLYTYSAMRKSLSEKARNFWDSHSAMIEKGVIYQGRWERYFYRLAKLISITRPRLLNKLFRCHSTSEQIEVWKRWDNFVWDIFLQCISWRAVWTYFFGDPGFYRYVPDNFSICRYLDERFTSAIGNILLRESPFATLLFWGRFNEGVIPSHLRRENYPALRENLPRIRIVTQSLLDFLEQGERNSIDKYSLSDFASYTGENEYVQIWNGIVRLASNRARLCERQFLVKREPPSESGFTVRRDTELEIELARTDNSIFYSFVVAEIHGQGE